eukprot:1951995-Amphidinium_carterae.1
MRVSSVSCRKQTLPEDARPFKRLLERVRLIMQLIPERRPMPVSLLFSDFISSKSDSCVRHGKAGFAALLKICAGLEKKIEC